MLNRAAAQQELRSPAFVFIRAHPWLPPADGNETGVTLRNVAVRYCSRHADFCTFSPTVQRICLKGSVA